MSYQIKINFAYVDDRALLVKELALLENFVALNGGLAISKSKLSTPDFQAAIVDCVTKETPGFAFLFEVAVKQDTTFRYLRTPSANVVIRSLLEAGYGNRG